MLAVLLAAGVISLIDSDEPSRAEVRFAPLVRNGHEVGLKVLRGKRPRFPASRAPHAPRRAPISQRGSSALPS
ncbi:MAG TPA: hypothetical protein VMZ28_27175 [Kofleriaceae bacterium]|nr:hypothetical protein [Kofleriaceae bacterium]